MIGILSRLFGRDKPMVAALNDHLVLIVARRGSITPGSPRGSARFGKRQVSIRELDAESAVSATGLEQLLDMLTPRLDQQARASLLEFILNSTQQDLEKPGAVALSRSLRLVRERLREELPLLSLDTRMSQALIVDAILAVDERSFLVLGWCRDEDDTAGRVRLVTPEGQSVELLEGSYRYHRPDVEESLAAAGVRVTEKVGFTKYLHLDSPSLLDEGWTAELRTPSGSGFQVPGPPVVRDPANAREAILGEVTNDRADLGEVRRDHGLPALEGLQRHMRRSIEIESVVQHGEPVAAPEVSVVIPLYERVDLVEHQIAQFWNDPDLAAADLIYVLDSPGLRAPLARIAADLHALYGMSFRVLTLNRNAGYSTANNLAASLARGRLLTLLNSDVLPDRHGWLGQMSSFYASTPEIGALGPKLLYEDGSIQHAGMYFQRDTRTGVWENQHYFKGFSASLPAANVSQPVPAVTGACLMVERALYEELGGLNESYVKGGYEDSDFCLRLVDAGRQNWYLSAVELFHLEAQSFRMHHRQSNSYNAWLQTHRWNERIDDLMSARPEVTEPHVVRVS